MRARLNTEKGFSLIELMVVMSIFAVCAVVGIISLRAAQEKYALEEGRETIVRSLENARNKAITGFGTSDHGIYTEEVNVIQFEGETYPGSGKMYALPLGVTIPDSGDSVIFSRLSGTVDTAATITVENSSGDTATIDISTSGAITSN